MPPLKNQLNVNIIVSGQTTGITINAHEKVEHLIKEALRNTGNQGQPPGEWELRTADGRLLELGVSIEDAGITEGATLYLNPRAGAGGNGRPCIS
jgi:hypothetical protein